MNVIFLDIDGVMNMYGSSSRTFMKPYGHHIERHLVDRLNYICENVKDLRIVISSAWRSDMEDLKKQLEEQGFKYWSLVIGRTCKPHFIAKDKKPPYNLKKDYLYSDRGDQVGEWLHRKQFKGNFIVIDDETEDICGEKCSVIDSECVYKIDGNEGMLHKDAINIIGHFND